MLKFFHTTALRNIAAVDIGTASVSIALARESETAYEILGIVREPFYLLLEPTDKGVARRVERALERAWEGAARIMPHADEIRIGLANPFFEEHRITTTDKRMHTNVPITKEEIHLALQKFKDTAPASENRTRIKEMLASSAVNGYPLKDPQGYRGDVLTLEAYFLQTSTTLFESVAGLHRRFWGSASVRWFSDAELLTHAVKFQRTIMYPAVVLDIGGEVTSVVWMVDDNSYRESGSVFVGLRTLERKVASTLHIDASHAESLVRSYSGGTLDAKPYAAMIPAVQSILGEWWDGVAKCLGTDQNPFGGATIVIAGQGRDVAAFSHFLEDRRLAFSHLKRPTQIVPLLLDDRGIPKQSLAAGGDILLMVLLSYDHAA